MRDGQRTSLSPLTVYAYSFTLKVLWIALAGPAAALLVLPVIALQAGEGQAYRHADIFDLSLRIAMRGSLGLLAILIPAIFWGDFFGRKRISWQKLTQRSQSLDLQDFWQPRKMSRALEECRQP